MSEIIFLKEELKKVNINKISKLLNIPVKSLKSNFVGITDSVVKNDKCIMSFHYHVDKFDNEEKIKTQFEDEEITAITKIRGVIVDINEYKIKCKAFPKTNTIIRSSVPLNGTFIFDKSKNESDDNVTISDITYKEWIYGALIRSFIWQDEVYLSTFKKISCEKSKFNGSDTLWNMFFRNQDVFTNPNEIFKENFREELIHMFIINDRELIVDSPLLHTEDKIFYINTLDLLDVNSDDESYIITENIKELNEKASKPIRFPKVLTVEQANEELSGVTAPMFEISKTMSPIQLNSKFFEIGRDMAIKTMYGNARKVLMTSKEYGLFTLLPSSGLIRSELMGGNGNFKKAFTDAYSLIINNLLEQEKLFIPFGFSREQLEILTNQRKHGLQMDFSNFETLEITKFEVLLSNFVLLCPVDDIDDCFNIYDEITNKIISSVIFIIKNKDEFIRHIKNENLIDMAGMKSMGATVLKYLNENLISCFNNKGRKTYKDIINKGINTSEWPNGIISFYNKNPSEYGIEEDIGYKNAVLSLVMSTPVQGFYSMINIEEKINKTRAAFAKNKD